MMMVPVRSVLTVAAVLCGCGVVLAEADYSTPKNAFRTYTKAIADGDIEVLKNASVTTPKHEQLLEDQVTYSATEKKFRDVCIKAFPAAEKDLPDPTQQTLNAITTAEVKIDGETATLQTRDSLEPVRLKRVDNRWKVDLATMYSDEAVDDVLQFRKALAYVMNDMTDDVKGGKFKTFDEVRNMMEMRVKMRMALPRDEEPATRPAS